MMATMALSVLYSQSEYDQQILKSFMVYKSAYLKVDRIKLAEMAHPSIVKMGGGLEFYLEEITSDYNMYASMGFEIKDLEAKQCSKVIKSGSDLQAMLPYKRSLISHGEEITEDHFFLITSQDGGKSWNFTDMKKYDSKSIKLFIPNYNERLNIFINSAHH